MLFKRKREVGFDFISFLLYKWKNYLKTKDKMIIKTFDKINKFDGIGFQIV